MQFEEEHPVFTDVQRRVFWKVINARNDAVHVQPDLAPEPRMPRLMTAGLLPAILPSEL